MQAKQRVLTGITTTGTPHLGNYLGALKPAVAASQQIDTDSFYFLADYHALIKCQDPQTVHRSGREIAAIWLALGLDTDKATFYRQSDIPEIPQLAWFLTCMTGKGMMNRAHAYKASVDENQRQLNSDLDQGISMGLYSYPILMAADILMFNAHHIPVGKDQIQHIEMCRDIAMRFNHSYGEHFVLPEAMVDEGEPKVLSGLDGRKMSKSYGNIIPLFAPADELKKLIFQITTNSLQPGEVKDPDSCTLFEIYSAFASPEETLMVRQAYANGIGWGDMKGQLFEYLNHYLTPARKRYEEIMTDPAYIEAELQKGAAKARAHSEPFMQRLRSAVGIMSLVGGVETKTTGVKAKKDLNQAEQAKVDAGKAKAIAIAKQRVEQETQQVALEVEALVKTIKSSSDPKAASEQAIRALQEKVDGAKKKAKKTLQQTLELLKQQLTH
ncbi:MAG: tryptophan--tRNA ligase [Oceanospirillaceae bacterium]|jgi:tryptophanyl-tRNA synthetase|nr:tryptophan--tRNA ligase [Oceanospirillaceae bacterium]MBT4997925.1 tryptophan--tRNA ligase [Oceanospirillaceae bacterium]MBT6101274.1 tryptophan--tRNA ligase [Oceanospirillaceae bacterium]MBT7673717.1 tryptophan--tRNA ligase [Oceanospirillaceae bacterium]MDO7574014.1 tryptophan--tRNA ligase [Oceanospirillaceae bacterium]